MNNNPTKTILPQHTFPYDPDLSIWINLNGATHSATLWAPVLTVAMHTTLLLFYVHTTWPRFQWATLSFAKTNVLNYSFKPKFGLKPN